MDANEKVVFNELSMGFIIDDRSSKFFQSNLIYSAPEVIFIIVIFNMLATACLLSMRIKKFKINIIIDIKIHSKDLAKELKNLSK